MTLTIQKTIPTSFGLNVLLHSNALAHTIQVDAALSKYSQLSLHQWSQLTPKHQHQYKCIVFLTKGSNGIFNDGEFDVVTNSINQITDRHHNAVLGLIVSAR